MNKNKNTSKANLLYILILTSAACILSSCHGNIKKHPIVLPEKHCKFEALSFEYNKVFNLEDSLKRQQLTMIEIADLKQRLTLQYECWRSTFVDLYE